MGGGEGTHGKTRERQPVASGKDPAGNAHAGHGVAQGRRSRQHRLARVHRRTHAGFRQAPQHHAEALHVVAVVVGDNDGGQARQVEAAGGGPIEELPLADAAIHEHALPGAPVLHNGRIAAAPAGQHVQLQHSGIAPLSGKAILTCRGLEARPLQGIPTAARPPTPPQSRGRLQRRRNARGAAHKRNIFVQVHYLSMMTCGFSLA